MSLILTPEDAAFIHKARLAFSELIQAYEARIGITGSQNLEEALTLHSPDDAYNFFRVEMEHLEQEQVRVACLNSKNRIISSRMVYQGTVNCSHVRPADVFRPAVMDNAVAIIIAHNHPTGEPTPSADDISVTRILVEAGEILGIDVLDHIVIGKGRYVSLKSRGLGFDTSGLDY